MSVLSWHGAGKRLWETGVDQGVLYVKNGSGVYTPGVAWNGLISVSENPSGAEPNAFYADNIKYANLMSAEEFEATIEAYTFPDEFGVCDGSVELITGLTALQQKRKTFGLVYRTLIGNDVDQEDHGYKLHLVYGCLASPSEKSYETINESPDLITFSWDVTTTPVAITGMKPSAKLVVDSTKVPAPQMTLLEAALFGTEAEDPFLPLPDAVLALVTPPSGE